LPRKTVAVEKLVADLLDGLDRELFLVEFVEASAYRQDLTSREKSIRRSERLVAPHHGGRIKDPIILLRRHGPPRKEPGAS